MKHLKLYSAPHSSPRTLLAQLLCLFRRHSWERSPSITMFEGTFAFLDWCKRPGCLTRRVRPASGHGFRNDPDYPGMCWACGKVEANHD